MPHHHFQKRLRPFPILRLATADLLDEWLLSFCIALAVASVLSPLLILFGLKNGAIEILRQRLVEDPRNREIRPKITRTFDSEWFDQMRKRPDVAFITPLTRGISSTVQAVHKGTGAATSLDLNPTAKGDALVAENGAPIPRADECVLSALAAESLGADAGDTVQIIVDRRVDGEFQTARIDLRVAGVLDLRAGGMKTAYVSLSVVEAVEQYLDGYAVPEYGWSGTRPVAPPEFDGALLLGRPGDMDASQKRKVITDTGFARLQELSPSECAQMAGFAPPEGYVFWLIRPVGSTVRQENLELLAEQLRGSGVLISPWVDSVPARLRAADGVIYDVRVKAAPNADFAARCGLPALAKPPGPASADAVLPGDERFFSGPLNLHAAGLAGENSLPLNPVAGTASQGLVLLAPETAGVLRAALSRFVKREPATGEFLIVRRGYSGFRLFADSIDHVDGLRKHLEKIGIPVYHEAERINDVRALDSQLSRFFWFIAGVGILGAVATLAASLYASAERKSYELAVLRLLGLRPDELVRFPACQAVILTVSGFLLALAIYAGATSVIDQVFGDQIKQGERLTSLPPGPVSLMLGALIALALVSSLLASARIMSANLSDALREGSQ